MFNKVVLSLLLTSSAINYAMDDGHVAISRKRPHGGDHKDESSAKRRIVVDLERLGMLARAAAIAEDTGKYRRAIMYIEGIAGLGLVNQAARDVQAARLFIESNTPVARFTLDRLLRPL
ncbi:MAG: hypothetical protein NT128_04005 [Proteobacteria bacterium]|nr:hypothetical protein [Pseudomonadota bacterium]